MPRILRPRKQRKLHARTSASDPVGQQRTVGGWARLTTDLLGVVCGFMEVIDHLRLLRVCTYLHARASRTDTWTTYAGQGGRFHHFQRIFGRVRRSRLRVLHIEQMGSTQRSIQAYWHNEWPKHPCLEKFINSCDMNITTLCRYPGRLTRLNELDVFYVELDDEDEKLGAARTVELYGRQLRILRVAMSATAAVELVRLCPNLTGLMAMYHSGTFDDECLQTVLAVCPRLQQLSISLDCCVSGGVWRSLPTDAGSTLRVLQLRRYPQRRYGDPVDLDLTGDDVYHLASHCPRLECVNLCDFALTDAGLEILLKLCPRLSCLRLKRCRITAQDTSAGLADLAGLRRHGRRLRTLSLNLCEAPPEALAWAVSSCRSLERLDLSMTNAEWAVMQAVAQRCTQLRVLNVDGTSVSQHDLSLALHGCPQLQEVVPPMDYSQHRELARDARRLRSMFPRVKWTHFDNYTDVCRHSLLCL